MQPETTDRKMTAQMRTYKFKKGNTWKFGEAGSGTAGRGPASLGSVWQGLVR